MSKPRTRFWKVAHAAQVTYRSPLCDSTFLSSLHLFVSCVGPLRFSMRHMPVETCQVLRNRTSVLDVKEPGLRPYLSSARPGDIYVGFARRRPPCPLCSAPSQEAVAGGRGQGPGSVVERCLIHMASWQTDSWIQRPFFDRAEYGRRTGKHAIGMPEVALLQCQLVHEGDLDL
jgi:hypothetical protein